MISVIIPFHNEKDNLLLLYKKLKAVFGRLKKEFEIVFVDDGSTDDSQKAIKGQPHTKLVFHKKRMGKGKALMSGFAESTGEVILFMDADLQDDPEDIELFLNELESGYDFVNGWRKFRKDPFFKKFYSSIFNGFLLNSLLRSKFHDINCGFKAMKREVLEHIPLYGDNYRFTPILADKEGFRTTEVVVHHHPRLHGSSKYGLFRVVSGFFDTLTTYFIYTYSEKPLHFFGPVGGVVFAIGFIICAYLAFEKIFFGVLLFRRPALLLGVLLIIVGIQIAMTGIIGELIVYFSNKNKK
ncbi:hypothetical protein A3G67_02970 [Candidatus Roizmanbacteria bacterium RIFCSPLOWO2_12_FULL_40_12]|uniref:Glycosyltransferase 2-like domain-containing protein n=1 Tax=Candidatus Roizmanbacteria bacterium RIFCSPLOWO2_01_FULL_40_42 TaxID=1802066 RepID=A0A1F7J2Q3_9BACT|nr:MAG: hypothetical protein A2779_00500 [Candidatus Roizmanbacteria bacterium RIFCSPHIGHO2_01_FULL_40_98]OGK27536.1 MAG: hypothetical protein A3C31_03655 [Candidatus Roizmanbacteria bacterium RIFCSPHIGHO2_02_FULL_40_53]OGK30292.1 MAG: hypothetical protein A2W49_01140 [Candidatus Roizmanbacteria bacterium RIFCSPHIGHO2_12_41_18]OGK37108.1 MAG: hypothetical protein A3E69_01455 [Candidatus Roizmanbacteria bacterium RIFCSPHIGHO2_12_FULL_40_130]OGK49898.1 MAG: hypothetical protein A3B50_03895 [Candi